MNLLRDTGPFWQGDLFITWTKKNQLTYLTNCYVHGHGGVDKRRTDGGRRTTDGGRRTADRGAFYKHMVINVLFHPFEFLEIKFF